MTKKPSMGFVAKVGRTTGKSYKGRTYTSFRITIPSSSVKVLGLARGDYVKVTIERIRVS